MMIKNIHAKVLAALAFSVLALSPTTQVSASQKKCCDKHTKCTVKPAQAIYQDESSIMPVLNQPIPFLVRGFNDNVCVNSTRTVFEIEVSGLYSIDAFLLVNLPNVGDSVAGYITINNRQLLPFYTRETRTADPVVELHFNDRLVYLEKGDKVSVVLTEFTPGTLVLSRGFVLVALNNSHK